MSENPKWQVARLDDIERRGRTIPVREHLGIHAFGVNAFAPDGNATFEIDGETFEAPAGTLVAVRPEARRKATGAGTILALGGTPGEAYQAIDWGEAWSFHTESMTAYGEQRYPEALEAVRRGLEHVPDHPALHF